MNIGDKLLLCAGIAVMVFSLALWLFSWLRDRRDEERQKRADDIWRKISKGHVEDWKKSDSDEPEPFEIRK